MRRGDLDEAERVATALGEQDSAGAHILGRIAELRGQLDRAESLYRIAVQEKTCAECALDYGLLLQARGRADEAKALLQPLLDAARTLDAADDLLVAGRAARALSQFRLANALFREAAAASPDSAEINAAWGDLLLEKHNLPEAVRSYELALKTDANYAPAHLGLARALTEDNPPGAAAAATRAFALDPSLWDALVVQAELALDRGDRGDARKLVESVLQKNPASLPAISLQAAIAWVEDRPMDFDESVQRALALNPRYGEVYRVAAEHAAGKYRFDDAAMLATRATALDPENARAWADLGKHLLRVGSEPDARKALDRAFDLDPFDQVTFNLLGMLDTLKQFQVIESGSVVVKLHPSEAALMRDAVVSLATRALESLSARYGFTPTGPILIEMFPQHDDFAVRNVGLPGMIGALGACFGRVVTLDSPAARQPPGSFNWAATLWHELAHVVTLQMSGQRVPRWLTEGLSVFEERRANPSWGRESELQFVKALVDGKTFTLASLNTGFSDPRRITLAYHQASLVAEHLVERFGEPVLGKLLRAYADRLDDEAALQRAANIGLADLQRSFDEFIERRFGAQRRALAPVETLEAAVASDDPHVLARLAAEHPDNYHVQMAFGRQRLAARDFAAARAAFERSAALVPAATGNDGPTAMLAEAAEGEGDTNGQRESLATAIVEDNTALELARRLLRVATAADDRERVRLAADRIAEVDPFDATAHGAIGRLALAEGKTSVALQAFRRALDAGPDDAVSAHTDLAEALLASGAADEAKREAITALELAPRFARAQDVLLAVVDGVAKQDRK